ncbi:MAG: iron ABC transporter permease [Proteobacteria bacterium]|nr:iron ABC transporter permease [Pseudomonadota bacterium]
MTTPTFSTGQPTAARRLPLVSLNAWSIYAVVIALLVSVPILVVFSAVFAPTGEVWRHLVDTVLWNYIRNTLWIMLGVGLATLFTGVLTAWLVTTCRFPGRRVFEWALLLPLAVPSYAIAFTYAGMFEFAGPVQSALREWFGWSRADYWFPDIRSVGGAVLVMGLVLYPYVYLLARAAFNEQSVCVLEASRALGRGPWRGFFQVALPLARPAIATGVALALMEALSEFGAVQYFAVDTFTTGIYRTWFGLGDSRAASQLAAILMAVVLVLLLIERRSRGQARYYHTSTRYRPLPGYRLKGMRRALAVLACFLPIFFGFLLPGAQLLVWSIQTAGRMIDLTLLRLAWNSISLAALAAVLAVMVAAVLAYGVRLRPSFLTIAATRVASMGYAVPGAVLAIGVLVPFAWIDNTLDAWMRSTFGVSTGLLLSGTLIALLFAYLVRFLAISFNTVEASLAKVTPNMDGAARSLGLGAGRTFFRVHAPIIGGSLLTAGLLVFVDVMKELPATLIMRPFNFNTLAVRSFELASDERLADSASAALAIVLAGLVPVILLSRAIARSRPGGGR